MTYLAGYNMVGYMPEVDPEEFDTEAEAREYLAGTLDRWADDEYMAAGEPGSEFGDFSISLAEGYGEDAKRFREGATSTWVRTYSADYSFWVVPKEGE